MFLAQGNQTLEARFNCIPHTPHGAENSPRLESRLAAPEAK